MLGHGERPDLLRREPLLPHRLRQVRLLGAELGVQQAEQLAVRHDRRAQAGAGGRRDEVLADQLRARVLDHVQLAAAQRPAVILADHRIA